VHSVNVVIPTMGRPELRRAVLSVMDQSVPALPIVVLDRPGELERVQENLDGLCYELHLTSGSVGGAAARNIGLRNSHCDYVSYLDDDDWWDSRKLERQLAMLTAAQEDGGEYLVTTFTRFHSADGSTRVLPEIPYDSSVSIADYLVDRSRIKFGRKFMQTSSLLGTRGLMTRFPWDEEMAKHQDWDLISRIVGDGGATILTVAEPLVFVAQASSHSVSLRPDWRASVFWLDKHRGSLSRKGKGDFVAALILRSALRQRDWRGVRQAFYELRSTRPHLTALVVALVGAVK
jgi:glycosyltransferase involved in cell wall biosynthesis